MLYLQHMLPTAQPSSINSLGKPTMKRRLSLLDLSALALSLLCLGLAIAAVENEPIYWRLGVGNNQLMVVGFLLSNMNLCLSSVAPTFFLLLEARFGSSTLQNYEGILRNKPLSSKLGTIWRIILSIMLVIPIALSFVYKNSIGGESVLEIANATN